MSEEDYYRRRTREGVIKVLCPRCHTEHWILPYEILEACEICEFKFLASADEDEDDESDKEATDNPIN